MNIKGVTEKTLITRLSDGRLRSLMSFGETDSDREAILKRIVGEDGYVRDKGGQLALTPTGQKFVVWSQ